MDSLFDRSQFPLAQVARELYDPVQRGIMCIPKFLYPTTLEKIMAEIEENKSKFSDIREGTYKHTTEHKGKIMLGSADTGALPEGFGTIRLLHQQYGELYKSLGTRARFHPALINSISLNQYPVGTGHISPHQDLYMAPYSLNVNLISIFSLAGKGKLAWCNGRSYTEEEEIDTSPGNLVLLRAPRTDGEKSLRPWHYVSNVTQERYTLIFRQRKQEGVAPQNMST